MSKVTKILIKIFLAVAALWVLLALGGECVEWGKRAETTHTVRYDVVRVFTHKPGQYSVLTKSRGSNQLVSVDLRYQPASIIADVPRDQPMWVAVLKDGNGNKISSEIHIHADAPIQGGGWDQGKSHGTTSVVE